MAKVIGNVGTAITPTVETLTSTNTGATVEVNSGVKVIRVPSGVTVSGGNSVGTPGLTVNGNGKAIVLQEGGNIVGGPGNTSNNYAGTGGQGAEAMVSNTSVKYIKTSGSIVGGGGGGGGPGKRGLKGNWNAYPTWNSNFSFTSNTMWLLGIDIYGAPTENKAFTNYTSTVSNAFNSLIKNNTTYNTGSDGDDGDSGTFEGPGLRGNDGTEGNNATSPNIISTNHNQNGSIYTELSSNGRVIGGTRVNSGFTFVFTNNSRAFYSTLKLTNVNTGAVSYNNRTVYRYSNGTAQAGNRNSGNKNANTARGSAGAGGQPGNAYNTTNTITPFGS